MNAPLRHADDPVSSTGQALSARRRRARRTALVMAGVAVLVYAGFILSGVLSA